MFFKKKKKIEFSPENNRKEFRKRVVWFVDQIINIYLPENKKTPINSDGGDMLFRTYVSLFSCYCNLA